MAGYIVLLGPPGAGKGTQAEILSERHRIAHISSGDLFRENIGAKTELGRLAKGYMDRGELVPDDVTIAMVKERLQKPDCTDGALLDGFPRTDAQAEALAKMLQELGGSVRVVPYIVVSPEVLVQRLSEGHVFNTQFHPPRIAGKCDLDGSELYQRDDDKPETVRNRIQVYFKQTAPLIEYYKRLGLLVEINGELPVDAVTAELESALAGRK
jgi:adenylate kinase